METGKIRAGRGLPRRLPVHGRQGPRGGGRSSPGTTRTRWRSAWRGDEERGWRAAEREEGGGWAGCTGGGAVRRGAEEGGLGGGADRPLAARGGRKEADEPLAAPGGRIWEEGDGSVRKFSVFMKLIKLNMIKKAIELIINNNFYIFVKRK